jgi:hypothetical protein
MNKNQKPTANQRSQQDIIFLWEVNVPFPSQKIIRLSWNSKVDYRVNEDPPFVSLEPHESVRRHPILCLRSALIFSFYLSIGPRNDDFSSCFFTKTLNALFFPTTRAADPNLIYLFLSIRILFGKEKNNSRSCSLCNFPSFYLHSLPLAGAFSSAFYSRIPVAYILPFHFPLFTLLRKTCSNQGSCVIFGNMIFKMS